MELNYSLKTAEEALAITAPDTCKFIKSVLTSRGGVEDKQSVYAITRLCELLKFHNNNLVKQRVRKLSKNMCICLHRLALLAIYHPYGTEFHRSKFMGSIGSNDFSVLQYWGFIEQGSKKGYWKITTRGVGFAFGIPGLRYANAAVIQLGGKKKNYTVDKFSLPVAIFDILETVVITETNKELAINFIENNTSKED